MNYLHMARRVLGIEIAELQRLEERLDESFIRAIDLIREVLDKRGKIVVLGVGKSGHIGEKIASTLTSTGALAVVLHSVNSLHGDLGVIADGDVILALSASGETEELVNLLPALRRFDAPIISMTGNAASTLAQHSAVHLDVSIGKEACPLNLAPTSSSIVMLALGDALAMVLLESRGFTEADFAKFHPGGQLGRRLLLKVTDIMRSGERIAIVPPETTIRETLRAMSGARGGAAIIVDPDGKLVGVFTHGDFARVYENEPNVGNHVVSNHMTRRPITISAGKLAVDVLEILERHRIDDLIVIDENNRPVGLVESQDLARFKLL
ncbi:MAG TPA: KpsF/GutQ family sugar-phosphate isomerase [Chthoniobacterales bacterium]